MIFHQKELSPFLLNIQPLAVFKLKVKRHTCKHFIGLTFHGLGKLDLNRNESFRMSLIQCLGVCIAIDMIPSSMKIIEFKSILTEYLAKIRFSLVYHYSVNNTFSEQHIWPLIDLHWPNGLVNYNWDDCRGIEPRSATPEQPPAQRPERSGVQHRGQRHRGGVQVSVLGLLRPLQVSPG